MKSLVCVCISCQRKREIEKIPWWKFYHKMSIGRSKNWEKKFMTWMKHAHDRSFLPTTSFTVSFKHPFLPPIPFLTISNFPYLQYNYSCYLIWIKGVSSLPHLILFVDMINESFASQALGFSKLFFISLWNSIHKLWYVGRRLSKIWEKKETNYLTIIATSNIDPHKNYKCCWINSYYAKNMFLNSMIFFTQSVKCCVCQIHRKVYTINTAGVCQKWKISMFKGKWIIPALRSYYKCLLFFTKISVVVWKRLVAI